MHAPPAHGPYDILCFGALRGWAWPETLTRACAEASRAVAGL